MHLILCRQCPMSISEVILPPFYLPIPLKNHSLSDRRDMLLELRECYSHHAMKSPPSAVQCGGTMEISSFVQEEADAIQIVCFLDELSLYGHFNVILAILWEMHTWYFFAFEFRANLMFIWCFFETDLSDKVFFEDSVIESILLFWQKFEFKRTWRVVESLTHTSGCHSWTFDP